MSDKYTEREKALLDGVGGLFKEMRTEKNLSGRQAADLVGLNQANISRLENGANDVSILKLQRIAESYGYNLEISVVSFDYNEEVA